MLLKDAFDLKSENQEQPVEDSLKKRYLFKLATNLIGFLITLVTAGLVPRALGPAAYGSFNFLSTFFNQIIGFFNAGTSLAFYTKLSQRPQEHEIVRFYWGFTGLVSLVTILTVVVVFMTGLEDWLWPNQVSGFIWLAAIWGLLTWYSQIINQILDAYGLTTRSEIVRIRQRALGLGLILPLFWLNRLNLTTFFIYHFIILLFLMFSWQGVLKRAGLTLFPRVSLTRLAVKNYSREFYDYCGPLVIHAFVSLSAGILDNWLLQRFAGSIQHGFFGLSFRISAITFLFTGAMTPLLMRELSRAFNQNNLDQMRLLFRRYIPLLYVLSAFFGVFLLVQADKVGLIFGGNDFRGAAVAVSIMALYPIHQTYGQLSGSVFYATGQTRLYRNVGISVILFGVPLTFWLIGPEHLLGLNLGATGLAIKMVLIQFIGVNVQLWLNARFLQLSFWRFFSHQFYSVLLLAGLAWLAAAGVDRMISNTLLAFFISGFIYSSGVIVLIFAMPFLIFMSRPELMTQVKQLIDYARSLLR